MDNLKTFFSGKEPDGFTIKDTYAAWYRTLTEVHLPLILRSICSEDSCSNLKEVNSGVLKHLNSFYDDLERHVDEKAISHIVSTSLHRSLESPLLFLGDLHPIIFTNLLRDFLDPAVPEDTSTVLLELERSSGFVNAWKDSPTDELKQRLEEIECSTETIVCALLEKTRCVLRDNYVARVIENWISSHRHSQEQEGKRNKTANQTTADEGFTKEVTDELILIFKESNRRRKSVIDSIMEVLNEHQKTVYLERLLHILVGIKDEVYGFDDNQEANKVHLLKTPKKDKIDLRLMLTNFIGGMITVPTYLDLKGTMTRMDILGAVIEFASAIFCAFGSSLNTSMTKGQPLWQSIKDSICTALSFLLGGTIILIGGFLIKDRPSKIIVSIAATSALFAFILLIFYYSNTKLQRKKLQKSLWGRFFQCSSYSM